jgi:prepilin-type N-terminal cleavage/methylation domain-containing protein
MICAAQPAVGRFPVTGVLRRCRPESASWARASRARRGAFTLVEVLLVLALLALLGTLLIPGVNSMLAAMNDRGAEQQLSEAILNARGEALETGRTVELRFDPETRQLVWGAGGTRADPLPLGTSLELLPMESGGNILLGGVLAEMQEPLRRVRFFPDGTCETFRIRLKETQTATPRLFVVDPWTCAVNPVAAKG